MEIQKRRPVIIIRNTSVSAGYFVNFSCFIEDTCILRNLFFQSYESQVNSLRLEIGKSLTFQSLVAGVGGSTRPRFQVSRSRELELRLETGTRLGSALSWCRVRHIMLENLIIMLFKRHSENYSILPKISVGGLFSIDSCPSQTNYL